LADHRFQEHRMSEDTPPLATLFDPLELESAAAACCGRFGEPAAEAQRVVSVRVLPAGGTALGRSLEAFGAAAAAHLRGVHCTASMKPEATRLAHAVVAWTEQVRSASNAYRDWQEQRTLSDVRAPERLRTVVPIGSADVLPPIVVSSLAPPA
jgi:hypothetical protein